ncbi:MAG: Hpt domain-containing protein [Planctomycetota bacterium]|nr:MAG: Hpt domain-containing protein [Planctomycetota bacterium]
MNQSEPTHPDDARVFDRQALMEYLDHDLDLFQELVEIFFEELPGLQSRLQQALQREDAPALRTAAHSLKGSVSQFAAVSARAEAARLEELADQGDLPACRKALPELLAAVQELASVLQRVRNQDF